MSEKDWENWHKTTNVGGDVLEEWHPTNEEDQLDKKTPEEAFKKGLQTLVDIVKASMGNGLRIRAFGSKWSLNNAAYTKDCMVKTWGLNYAKIGLEEEQVTDAYKGKDKGEEIFKYNKLCFIQSGVMIKDLNEELKKKSLSLKTTGASDGQRLVGAISTGTHGSAMGFGAMQDFVKGIHLVIPDGDAGAKTIFIQRKTDQVVNDKFATFLGSTKENKIELKMDDDLFNAALVSFGCFGLIHGVLIETEPLFQLEYQTIKINPKWYKDNKLEDLLKDPTRKKLKGVDNNSFFWLKEKEADYPYFFSVNLNPYERTKKQSFFIQVMEKQIFDKKKEKLHKPLDFEKHEIFNKKLKEKVLDNLKEVFKERIKNDGKLSKVELSVGLQAGLNLFHHEEAVGPKNAKKRIFRTTPDVVFHTKNSANKVTNSPCPATSTEIAVPISRVNDAIECILDVLQTSLLAAPLGIRYLPHSSATLAVNQPFVKIDDNGEIVELKDKLTVTIELPGPDTGTSPNPDLKVFKLIPDAEITHTAIFEKLKELKIPHRFHWGQQYPINKDWVIKSYGLDKVNSWKAARASLLTTDKARKIFSNDLTDSIGLT